MLADLLKFLFKVQNVTGEVHWNKSCLKLSGTYHLFVYCDVNFFFSV